MYVTFREKVGGQLLPKTENRRGETEKEEGVNGRREKGKGKRRTGQAVLAETGLEKAKKEGLKQGESDAGQSELQGVLTFSKMKLKVNLSPSLPLCYQLTQSFFLRLLFLFLLHFLQLLLLLMQFLTLFLRMMSLLFGLLLFFLSQNLFQTLLFGFLLFYFFLRLNLFLYILFFAFSI